MAAITATKRQECVVPGGRIIQFYGTSASNQADTLTTGAVPDGKAWRLLYVTVAYDGAATYTGTALTVATDHGVDAIYDTTLASGTDNTRYTVYTPGSEIWLIDGDAVIVSVPAGGAGREASVTVTFFAK